MNLIQKGHEHTHRGIIGIESAIVLIAFVIVAAALAFVVLNMGF
ncbi:MAG: flagellin, partial [Thaumarchaeota archaeon]|nr:flagellin [Nitrososphaerota archaeon]